MMSHGFEHPPCSGRGKRAAVVVHHNKGILVDTQFASESVKALLRRHHVRQGRIRVAKDFVVIKALRIRDLVDPIFFRLGWNLKLDAAIEDHQIGVVQMLLQPLRRDEWGGHCYSLFL
ncbi:Uncharacterised protein [Vibrio cholerae]|uniref:Uncharacterized protein n=1 Tax=Vibrio cholerae TaxID=666 RepID=A0A655ZN62_VIBCL|nr:Uncharacterised protein [Vibrio cholerae]CSB77531.1 Uncharacterised protein [Vibrio cholerae]CSC19270.1 Uncharacterised protein [Vibrio cholerae]CSC72936.1 Uncharacterised protein [Vibrio cholerae]CSC75634.1 Uncharacterised protein [Vibrio cholerae]